MALRVTPASSRGFLLCVAAYASRTQCPLLFDSSIMLTRIAYYLLTSSTTIELLILQSHPSTQNSYLLAPRTLSRQRRQSPQPLIIHCSIEAI
jgi:hypothetical protein